MARAIAAREAGEAYTPEFPTVDDGVRGMAFISSVLASAQSANKWYKMEI